MEYWKEDIRRRLDAFSERNESDGFAISIKFRPPECFCRGNHAPVANRLIDDYQRHHPFDRDQYEYVEHESGPELLVYLAVGVAALGVLKSVIELATAIVKARSEGAKKGDQQHGPLVIVVRGFWPDGEFFERPVIKAALEPSPNEKVIGKCLIETVQQIANEQLRPKRETGHPTKKEPKGKQSPKAATEEKRQETARRSGRRTHPSVAICPI